MSSSFFEVSSLSKLATSGDAAPGLPSRSAFPTLPVKKGVKWQFFVQRHVADRAGEHLDLRLVDDKGRAFSWAMKGGLPGPGKVKKIIEQPVHRGEYAGWEGVIESGYGKGKVSLEDKSDADVLESGPDKITFVLPRGRVAEEYTFVRTGGREWLVVNHSTTPSKFDIERGKPKYGRVPFSGVQVDDPDQIMTAKIGGAHAIVLLEKGKHPRLFSYRVSARGIPLEYTHKMPMAFRVARWNGPSMVVRGEVYGVDTATGKAIHETQLGGILNSTVDRAQDMMRERGIELRLAPFMVWSIGGWRFSGNYDKHLEILRSIEKALPATKLPPMAVTPEQKASLLKKIESGALPETREGVVLWDRNRPDSQPVKAKIAPDFDVYVRDVFMEKGKRFPKEKGGTELQKTPGSKYVKRFRMPDGSIRYEYDTRAPMAGGFKFSLTPTGPIVGKVGTGLDFRTKRLMAEKPGLFKGLVARVTAQEQYPSGALAKPSFKSWHTEKSPRKVMRVL